MPKPKVRKGMPSVQLVKEEFSKRARERFYDPTFTTVTAEIDRIIDVAWKNYTESHKSPRTRQAGRDFSDPEFPLPIEWLETRKAIEQAEKRQKNPRSNSRILLINGSTRSDQTCPGEMSKTFRLAKIAEEVIVNEKGFELDFLDLSRLPDEEELDASVDNIGASGKHADPVRLYLRRSTGASSTRARLVSQPLCRYATGLVHVNSLSWTCYSAYRVEANIQLRTV